MNIIERARAIIVNPSPTWVTIEQENTAWQGLYMPYLATLALVPALASFIGWSVLGVGGIGTTVQLPLLTGLGLMFAQYAVTLVMVAVWGWIISMCATSFGGQASVKRGVQLSVYASTPAMLVGVFSAVPALSLLALVGALYALYLVYLGLPILMKCPPQRALGYVAVAAVGGIFSSLVISIAGALIVPTPLSTMHESKGASDAAITAPPSGTTKTAPANTDLSSATTDKPVDPQKPIFAESMQDMAKRLEALALEQEKAKK